MTLDTGAIGTGAIVALLTLLGGLMIKVVRSVDALVLLIQGTAQYRGLLTRVDQNEADLRDLREWALSQGFTRRHGP